MNNQNARLYVGGYLSTSPTEKLEEVFGKYGKILEVKRNRNFSFIQFADEGQAKAAIKGEHGKNYFGKTIHVQIAKQSRPSLQDLENKDSMRGGDRGGPPNVFPGPPFSGGFDKRGDDCFRDQSPGGFRNRGPPPPDDRFDGGGFGGPGGPMGGPPGPGGFNGQPRMGGMGMNRGPRLDEPPARGYEHPPTQPPRSLAVSHDNRSNDVEIIVINKNITGYGEMIEEKLKSLGFSVDLLFPNEEVPVRRVLANIASRGTLYAVLITPRHSDKRSLTLNILHGAPQEHRNMLVEDAVTLISRNYEMYVMQTAQKNRELPPEDLRAILSQFLQGRPLTHPQIDKVLMFFNQLKIRTDQQMMEGGGNQPPLGAPNPSMPPQAKGTSLQETELQNRILNILNKGGSGGGGVGPVVKNSGPVPGGVQAPPGGKPPLLNDPSVQKAIDNLIQGFNPNNRMQR